MNITIKLDEEERKILEKRAKKNLMTLQELIQDIIRRSCVMTMNKTSSKEEPCDDKLVKIFSKSRRGRKRKKKSRFL